METKELFTLLVVLATWVAAIATWIAVIININTTKRKRKDEFEDHGDACRGYRNQFWSPLEKAYEKFSQNKQNAPKPLKNLIESVGMPPNLPIKKGRLLNDWIEDNKGSLNYDRRIMLDFVNSVYPSLDDHSGDIMNYSIIENPYKQKFHENRRKLTEFYEKWPRRIGVKNVRSSNKFEKNELYILCWLDIALRQWNIRFKDRGKEWMYKLGNI